MNTIQRLVFRFSLVAAWLLTCSGQVIQAQSWQWLERFGSAGNGNTGDILSDWKTDGAGNLYICGAYVAGTTFGGDSIASYGASDIFIAKHDCLGNLVWIKTAGGPSSDGSTGIALDYNGSIYITGRVTASFSATLYFGDSVITQGTSDLYIAKYDTAGNFLWLQVAAPGPQILNSHGFGIAINRTGDPVVFGSDFGSGGDLFPGFPVSNGFFMAEFSPSGAIQDVKMISQSTALFHRGGLKLDNNDNRYIAGYFNADSVYLGSTIVHRKSQYRDGFIARFNPSGSLVWYVQLGDSAFYGPEIGGFDVFNSEVWVCGEGEKNFPVGSFSLNSNLPGIGVPFYAKFNSSGTCIYADNVQVQSNGIARGIKAYNDTVLFTGTFRGMAVLGGDTLNPLSIQDGFLAGATTAGIFDAMALPATGTDYDEGRLVTVDPWRNLYVSGTFGGTLQLGSHSVTNSGGSYDGFMARYGSVNCITGLQEPEHGEVKLSVSPNPASDQVTVSWSKGPVRGITVVNALGAAVVQQEIPPAAGEEGSFRLDTSHWPAGVYLVKVLFEKGGVARKMIRY